MTTPAVNPATVSTTDDDTRASEGLTSIGGTTLGILTTDARRFSLSYWFRLSDAASSGVEAVRLYPTMASERACSLLLACREYVGISSADREVKAAVVNVTLCDSLKSGYGDDPEDLPHWYVDGGKIDAALDDLPVGFYYRPVVCLESGVWRKTLKRVPQSLEWRFTRDASTGYCG